MLSARKPKKNVIGVELIGVVYDVVVGCASGRTKTLPPQSILDAGAGVQQEMIAVQMGGAAGGVTKHCRRRGYRTVTVWPPRPATETGVEVPLCQSAVRTLR